VGKETLVLNRSTAAFADATAAPNKTVTAIGYSLANGGNGGLASNYQLTGTTATTTATIARKGLVVSGLSAADKIYDGSNSVTIINWGSVKTGVGNETLVLNRGTASFGDANAAPNKPVTAIGYSLSNGDNGGLASNYALTSTTATTTANVNSPTQATNINATASLVSGLPIVRGESDSGSSLSGVNTLAVSNGTSSDPGSPGVTVQIVQSATPGDDWIVSVVVPRESLTVGPGFAFQIPKKITALLPPNASLTLTTEDGVPLNGVSFDLATGLVSMPAVADREFPFRVRLAIADQRIVFIFGRS